MKTTTSTTRAKAPGRVREKRAISRHECSIFTTRLAFADGEKAASYAESLRSRIALLDCCGFVT